LIVDYPFDPVEKHMSHVWEQTLPDGQRVWRVAAKGAVEGLVAHCTFTPGEQAAIETAHANLARQGMRVLAVAQREVRTRADVGALDGALASETATERVSLLVGREHAERELQFLGFLGYRDPLRLEVPAAIAECQAAGIAVKLITGDHVLTAHAIADAAGITHTPDGLLTGSDLDAIPKSQLAAQAARASIFACIRPEQKHAIVDALKQAGEIVAMTGDGINDAPALRRADIGISMGAHATEVARAAADLVLLEDIFASLVATVREGRHILGNIQRAFLYLLAFHIPILGLALIVPLAHLPLLFLPIHLVWLEMIVHPVSALIFEGEPAPPVLMRRPPRDP
jgi:Ca2+-transporting ATPase